MDALAMGRGRLVVFEGIDGSGKTSVAQDVYEALEGERDVVLTVEPTDSWLGEAVRKSHAVGVDPYTEAFLFMADRAAHTEQIRQWLSEGKLVLCDRYYPSTVAYQSASFTGAAARGAFEWLLEANRRISLRPDLTCFLAVDPELAFRRVRGRTGTSKFERLVYLRKVDRNYRRLAKIDPSFVTIDASGLVEDAVDEVLGLFLKRRL